MDVFWLDLMISRPSLEVVPISAREVLIDTPRVLIGTLKCRAHSSLLVRSGLFFSGFLGRELYLDVFSTRVPR